MKNIKNKNSAIKQSISSKNNSVFYGVVAGTLVLLFYLVVLSFFQGFEFLIFNFRELWYFIIPLAAGFGIQIGLFASIKHSAVLNAEVATSGGVSGGSMVVCCTHFLLNAIPILGLSGLATFLMAYQKWFFVIGIISNIIGIGILINHKKKMRERDRGDLNE
jgi:Cu+-exporting ATPase